MLIQLGTEKREGAIIYRWSQHRQGFENAGSRDRAIDLCEAMGTHIPRGGEAFETAVDMTYFRDAVQDVWRFASSDKARHNLYGVLFSVKDQVARLVATDGYRLHCAVIGNVASAIKDVNIMLPTEMVKAISKHPRNHSSFVEISYRDGLVVFGIAQEHFVALPTNSVFPEYERLYPVMPAARIAVETEPFLRAVRGMKGRVVLSVDNGSLSVCGGEEAMPAAVFETEEADSGKADIAVRAKYLTEALKALGGARVRLKVNDDVEPLILECAPHSHVIMPCRK